MQLTQTLNITLPDDIFVQNQTISNKINTTNHLPELNLLSAFLLLLVSLQESQQA